MTNQKEMIKKEWDILIMIDACRYDYFEEVYKDYFPSAKLTKTISPTTFSFGWLFEMFNGTPPFDGIFISSDYEVANSEGIKIKIHDRIKRKKYGNKGFDPAKQFPYVVDVWKKFDKELGMIHPKTTTEDALKWIKINKHRKFIINYWQLHDPYIYYLDKGLTRNNLEDVNIRYQQAYKWTNLKQFIGKFISDEKLWSLMLKMGEVPSSGLAEMWVKFGRKGIQKGYKEDLKLILQNIKMIIDKYPNKKFVITSDHGELLGEYGRYGHGINKDYKELKEVPWLEIRRK